MGNRALGGRIPRPDPKPSGDGILHRDAEGHGPAIAPEIVHEVLGLPGGPIRPDLLHEMEGTLGTDFADVRIHTDERAGQSAEAVGAKAYTVGRHIVFAPGRFDPASGDGRKLLAHELTHAASSPPGAAAPAGELRISSPNDEAERHATRVANFTSPPHDPAPPDSSSPAGLFRANGTPVAITGVSVNHNRVTVPPVAGLAFSASPTPANATAITFALSGVNATIAAGTSIDPASGAITVAADQTGGSADVEAAQTVTAPNGSSTTTTATAPFNFTAIPSGISSTSTSTTAPTGMYGGDFTHTFTSPGGGQTALERTHVNERFASAAGTSLRLRGPLGNFTITVNSPNAASAGWDLDSAGTMAGPDHVTWDNTVSARPFVVNASNPTPTNALPQELTAAQTFRNLDFPGSYNATAATTTHRRAFEDRNDRIKAVTSANATGINQEVIEDYVGPTVFRRATATPASVPAAVPASTISVDAEGQTATPTFSLRSPDLGCTINANGELTPGTTPGTVTVRAGDTSNFDETTVTITPPPGPAPTP